jgi:hypothetical protein
MVAHTCYTIGGTTIVGGLPQAKMQDPV